MGVDNHLSLAERVAMLEADWENTKEDLKEIKDKLDQLIELKHKGLGALGLVSLLIGSGVVGLVLTILNLFKSNHL